MSADALFQLGMDLDAPKTAQKEDLEQSKPGSDHAPGRSEAPLDFFIEKDGVRCAGSHFIVDIYGGKRLDDIEHVERTLVDCVDAAGATLLHVHLHPFEPNGGVSGVAVLAESHISIHSWPERDYAALDIFMCGRTRPERCLKVLEKAFSAKRMTVRELLRGKEVAASSAAERDVVECEAAGEADAEDSAPAEQRSAEVVSAEALPAERIAAEA